MPVDYSPLAHPKGSTKLDRAIATKAARLLDAKQLRVWAAAVKNRDQWKDRKTGVRVRSTRRLDPLRAEAHHIASKDDWNVRTDVRNGLCLSFATHYAVEHNQLRIEGTVFFTKNGCRYIDGTHPVFFVCGCRWRLRPESNRQPVPNNGSALPIRVTEPFSRTRASRPDAVDPSGAVRGNAEHARRHVRTCHDVYVRRRL